MNSSQKGTVYIDIDDEITAIIDKVQTSPERIIALVLPKRAAVLQSIINMKLLKRTAENARKHVVLITTEAGIMPLAGAVGLHVAPSLQSRPAIPPVTAGMAATPASDESADFDPDAEANKPVGQLAGPAAVMADDMETIVLEDDDPANSSATALAGSAAATGAATLAKKDSKLKIPDFNKFRLGLALGGVALVALLVFGYFAVFVMPAATVTLSTDSSDIPTNASLTLNPAVQEYDPQEKVLPAKIEQKQQSGSQQVMASGQKNKGSKSSGEVLMTAQVCGSVARAADVPAGTGVSNGGKTFITQEEASFKVDDVDGECINFVAQGVTPVVAQSPGTTNNIGPSTFTVAGRKDVAAKSSEPMTGGTDNIVKVVAQSDIDSAKQKITSQDSSSVKADLQQKLEDADYYAVTNSLQAGEPTVTPSASVGDETDTVTVTSAITYTMYGVLKSDIEDFIRKNVEDQIDPRKQKILGLGMDKATFDVVSPASRGPLQVSFSATTLAGPDINMDDLKKQIAGKKTNDVRTIAKATPGVSDVSVNYSPFWVSKVPGKVSKITVVIEKTPATSNGN